MISQNSSLSAGTARSDRTRFLWFWNRGFIPYNGGREFRQSKHPDFALASCSERIGSGDASAGELQQIATFDAEKLRRLVGRDERLWRHGHLPRLSGSDNRCRSGESSGSISRFSPCGLVQRQTN